MVIIKENFMNVQRWIARREPNWKQLDTILQQVEKKGLKSLNSEQIRHFTSLYRSVSADLARAKTQQVGESIVRDLQILTTRSYNQIYQGSRRQEWGASLEFYRWGFPAALQENWVYIAIATAIFLLGMIVSWWFAWQDPTFISLIAPPHIISQVRDRQELWMGSIVGVEPFASSQIMVNNIKVSFTAIAGGIPAGLLTVYILVFNGVLMGTLATLVWQNNLAYPFWAFVFPHGSLELPAIFIAGGAGLLIARAIVFPGSYRRRDALKIYSSKAANLVYGIIPLLIIAGMIEGFFSPNPSVPDSLKYLVGTGLFAGLILYASRKQ